MSVFCSRVSIQKRRAAGKVVRKGLSFFNKWVIRLFISAGIFLGVQGVFYVVLKSHGNRVAKILNESLDAGLYDSDFQNASVLVRNLEKGGLLKCVTLEVVGIERAFVVYKSAIEEDCLPTPFFLFGIPYSGSLVSKDGNSWVFQYVVPTQFEFSLILWFVRFIAAGAIFFFFHFVDKRLSLAAERERELALNMRAIAHDLTSPIGMLRLIGSSNLELNEDRLKDYLDKATIRLSEISRTILDGTLDIDSFKNVSFNLVDAISEVISEKSSLYRDAAAINCSIRFDNNVCNVLGHENKFKRTLSNLIDNAFESTEGDVLLLDLSAFKDESRVFLEISDNGSGFPDSILAEVGQKILVSSKKGGNGLGLFLAKKDLNEWGGDILIKKTGPSGTVVMVSLLLKAAK